MVDSSSSDDAPPGTAKVDQLWHLFLLALVATGLWALTAFVLSRMYTDLEQRGQFGDAFGAVNALFSGLAMAGVIYTIYLQRSELKQQREELRSQREEMSKMVATQLRQLHTSLLTLSLTDPNLLGVWPEAPTPAAPKTFEQQIYVNLILSNWEMQFTEGLLGEKQLKALLTAHFAKSEPFRAFWVAAKESRHTMSEVGPPESRSFHRVASEAYDAWRSPG